MSEKRDEKELGGEIVANNKFLSWLDNFWYHYKWHVIVIAFFVFVFAVCFAQCAQKEEVDVPVVFAGAYVEGGEDDYAWNEDRRNAIEEILEGLYKKSTAQERAIGFLTYDVLTEEELRAKATEPPKSEAETGEFSNTYYNSLKQNNLSEINRFSSYMQTGQCSVWFVSEFLYEEQGMEKLAMPLESIFEGTLPESAYDAYAIRLGDTDLYRYYDAFHAMPEDTLIVLTRGLLLGASSDDAVYHDYLALYRAIVTFEKP